MRRRLCREAFGERTINMNTEKKGEGIASPKNREYGKV
jgi:hypothetical protein